MRIGALIACRAILQGAIFVIRGAARLGRPGQNCIGFPVVFDVLLDKSNKFVSLRVTVEN